MNSNTNEATNSYCVSLCTVSGCLFFPGERCVLRQSELILKKEVILKIKLYLKRQPSYDKHMLANSYTLTNSSWFASTTQQLCWQTVGDTLNLPQFSPTFLRAGKLAFGVSTCFVHL